MSKKPITVTLKEGNHKTQSWSYTIDKPGPGPLETKRTRYSTAWGAKRAAMRELNGIVLGTTDRGKRPFSILNVRISTSKDGGIITDYIEMREIVFVVTPKGKKK